MRRDKGSWLLDLVVAVVALGLLAAFLLPMFVRSTGNGRARCLSNLRQIGMAMVQYATDHADKFMMLSTGTGDDVEYAVDPETGVVSGQPATAGFAVLIQEGYITGYTIFRCPSSTEVAPRVGDGEGEMPVDPHQAALADLILAPEHCSYGYDITKNHAADPNCAILADKPPLNVSAANSGTHKNNSLNHRGDGQNIWYNDGHVKWSATTRPDDGDDPDIYLGGVDYEFSYTDAKIIR